MNKLSRREFLVLARFPVLLPVAHPQFNITAGHPAGIGGPHHQHGAGPGPGRLWREIQPSDRPDQGWPGIGYLANPPE